MNDFRYDSQNDVYQHLHQTVVLDSSGIPFFITASGLMDWDWKVLALGDTVDLSEQFDIRELGISFEPISLGYCNHENVSNYLVRRAVRMWKQGLSLDHLKAKTGYLFDEIMISASLRDTILNNYPSIKSCYAEVTEHGGSVAFHRDFAFTSPAYPVISLEYKGDTIGFVNKDGDFDINDQFFFVKEQLEEVIRA